MNQEFLKQVKQASEIADKVSRIMKIIPDSVFEINKRFNEAAKSIVQTIEITKQWHDKSEIKQGKANKILIKYHWLMSGKMDVDEFIDFREQIIKLDIRGNKEKEIKKLFLNYYSKNNWKNLEEIIDELEDEYFSKKHFKIVKNCFEVVKNSKNNVNLTDVILPTLIIQIEILLKKFLTRCNVYNKNNYYSYEDLKKNFKKSFKKTNSSLKFNEPARDVFVNILFQDSNKSSFDFNRHKILHGRNIDYGKKEYLIRAFLIIDFLSDIIHELELKKSQNMSS